MNDQRAGGMLLVGGNLAGMLTMMIHPVAGHGPMTVRAVAHLVLVDRVAHGLAIVGVAAAFLGALALSGSLRRTGWLGLAAVVAQGFAAVAIMIAAAMSGFVAADLLSRVADGSPQSELWRLMLGYTFCVNQAFAAIYTVGSCVAIVLWSLAMRRGGRWPGALVIYGLVIGSAIPPALFAGWLKLDVHGFGLVVFAQAAWFISAGILLMRAQADPEMDRLRA